jgi:hypothetical protein
MATTRSAPSSGQDDIYTKECGDSNFNSLIKTPAQGWLKNLNPRHVF